MKKKLLCSLAGFLCLLQFAVAQDRQVKGKVSSAEANLPMPGVTVQIKGTNKGVSTNANGEYQISVGANASLIFSFIGCTSKEVAVGNQTSIDVSLSENAQNLNEVVVVGYGSQKKANLTGSVSQFKNEELTHRQVPSTSNLLLLGFRLGSLLANPVLTDPISEFVVQAQFFRVLAH